MRILFISLIFLFAKPQPQTQEPNKFIDYRDGHKYTYTKINKLNWMIENLQYKTELSTRAPDSLSFYEACGEFYLVEEALTICPKDWRLPTEKEVKALVKLQRRNKININDTLQIDMCGRIDAGEYNKPFIQNTYWIQAELKDGYITHWHNFGDKQELHNHNVASIKRKFPVRCVCEIN